MLPSPQSFNRVPETFCAPPSSKDGFQAQEGGLMKGFVAQAFAAVVAMTMIAAMAVTSNASAQGRTSTPFAGVKANTGRVTLTGSAGALVLTLSDDFKAPEAPDPHWQVVDSKGRVYLLQKLTVKGFVGDKMNRSITLPAYITDVAKVQFWCAYAEVLLGEASFGSYSTN
jgi:hypothetical protein